MLPFDWGTEFLGDGLLAGPEARAFLHRHVEGALADTDAYFPAASISDFRLQDSELTFSSPVVTRYHTNNLARGGALPGSEEGAGGDRASSVERQGGGAGRVVPASESLRVNGASPYSPVSRREDARGAHSRRPYVESEFGGVRYKRAVKQCWKRARRSRG